MKKMIHLLILTALVLTPLSVADEETKTPELSVWSDPEFQKDFLGTYGFNSDIEPPIRPEESEVLQEILALLEADDEVGAEEKLLSIVDPPAPEETKKSRKKKRKDEEETVAPAPSAVFQFLLGNIYFQREDWKLAAKHFTLATAQFPSYRRAHKNLGLVHVREGSFERAIEPLSEVIRLGGEEGLVYGLLGYAYSSTSQWVAAESAYRNAMLLEPGTIDWKLGLTQSVMRQQKFGESISLANELITQFPDRTDYWLLQANAYIGNNQPMRAAQNYEMLERMGKSTVGSLNTLGDIYVNEQMWDLAQRAYARAAELDASGTVDRPLRNVEALALRGALPQARALIEPLKASGAQMTEDERIKLLKLEARIAVAEGSDEDSVDVLEQIVALNPLDGEALILLGQHYSRIEEPDKAIMYYERAESLEEFEADASVRHAQLLVGQARYVDAVPLLKRAQELEPRDDVGSYLEQVERAAKSQR